MRVIECSDFEKNASAILASCNANRETVVIKGANGEEVVMHPISETWDETAYLLSSPANAAALQTSIEEANQGKIERHDLINVC